MAKELPWMKNNMTNEVGSLFFRAPELLLGATSYGEEIDVWSLGCILYEMAYLTRAFDANDFVELGGMITRCEHQPFTDAVRWDDSLHFI